MIETCITELRKAVQALAAVADLLAAEMQPAPKPITLEQVRAVLVDKSRSGFTAEVRSLLEKHGAAKLSEVDPAVYYEMLTEAEAIGDA